MSRKAAFHNLGCKVNSYEMDVMLQELKNKGYEIVPFEEKADIYIVNTCTVTNIADRKSRQMLHKAKKTNPEGIVVAVGCYVQSDTQGAREDDAVDLIIGNNKKKDLVSILENYMNGVEEEAVIDINHTDEYEEMKLTGTQEHTRAYIKIQDGCNQFCSYCLIPYARGRVRSRKSEDIVEEITGLAQAGYQEFVLTGIHISSYGIDFEEKGRAVYGAETNWHLLKLLQEVDKIPGVTRLRLGSLEPRVVTEDFCRRLSVFSNLCPQFHLSMQSGSDTVLSRMKRKYDTARYYQSVELLRKFFPECAVTTDMIVAFPGETEEEFAESLAFIRKCAFADMHIFPYSRRPGTPADKMPGQHNNATKETRSRAAIALAEEMSQAYREGFVGRTLEVLFEEREGEFYTGHAPNYIKVYARGENLHNEIRTVTVLEVYRDGVLAQLKES